MFQAPPPTKAHPGIQSALSRVDVPRTGTCRPFPALDRGPGALPPALAKTGTCCPKRTESGGVLLKATGGTCLPGPAPCPWVVPDLLPWDQTAFRLNTLGWSSLQSPRGSALSDARKWEVPEVPDLKMSLCLRVTSH